MNDKENKQPDNTKPEPVATKISTVWIGDMPVIRLDIDRQAEYEKWRKQNVKNQKP